MIGGTKRLLKAYRAVLADRHKTVGEAEAPVADERDPTAHEAQL